MSAQQLVTENIDLWTSAIKAKSTQGRGSNKKRELYGIKKLRELILELAVHGKLVPQDSRDEPAGELLGRIAVEKEMLIKDKKIKKQKPLPKITDEEKPFNLPDGWEWVLLPTISTYMTGKTPATKNSIFWGDTGEDYPWVSIADMKHYGEVIETSKKVSQESVEQVFKYSPVKAGTILMSFKLTLGKVSILGVDSFHNEAIISITPFSGVVKNYLFRVLPQRALAGNSKKAIKGNTLNSDSIARISIPLPPEKEQHRIATKVDELMSLCDQLEKQTESSLDAHNLLVDTLLATLTDARDAFELSDNWARLADHFDTLITTDYAVEQLKQTILQLAVQGKLVPQDPSDEPASKLLKRIGAKKEQLIKDKKIREQKPLPIITDEEKPFNLPDGWEVTRFGDLTSRLGSGSTPRGGKTAYVSSGIPFLRSQNVWNDGLKLDDVEYISNETHLKMNNTKVVPGDVLLNITGASLGRSTIFPKYLDEANVSQHVTIIRLLDGGMARFVHLGILSPLVQRLVWGRQVGMAIEGLSKKVLEQFEFPVPPLNEQHRIVARVGELMTLCDQLKACLNDAQTIQSQLTDAVVDNALAL